MATKDKDTVVGLQVIKTITVGLETMTVDDVVNTASTVGAPATATVGFGGAMPRQTTNSDGTQSPYYQFSVTYTWPETM